MTPAEVTTTLRQFNEWRRSDYEPSEQPAPPDPLEIGEAIDAAVEMIERLEAAESEALEQARLNGIGAERELALMAKLEAAEKERDALRTVLTDLLSDLEDRAKWNLEESQRVVACGNGVYMRAKAALEKSK